MGHCMTPAGQKIMALQAGVDDDHKVGNGYAKNAIREYMYI